MVRHGKTAPASPRLGGALSREVERRLAPPQCVPDGARSAVRQHRQDVPLRVPEGVPVVPRAGEALRRDRAPLRASCRLEDVKEREAHCLLELGVAVELDVGAVPEVVQVGAAPTGDRPSPCVAPRRAPPRPRPSTPGATVCSTTRRRGTSPPSSAHPARDPPQPSPARCPAGSRSRCRYPAGRRSRDPCPPPCRACCRGSSARARPAQHGRRTPPRRVATRVRLWRADHPCARC